MLDILSQGFDKARQRFAGRTTLSEDNIQEAVEDIRVSLLEADVEYGVVKKFIQRVKEEALGQSVKLKAGHGTSKMRVTAADHFTKICQEQLEQLMGPVDSKLKLPSDRPAIIMMVGLQGSGKTTSSGKLTKYLIEKYNRRPLLVAADIYRPAAVEQLKVLGEKLSVPVYHEGTRQPEAICEEGVNYAKENGYDTVIFDTAGRLAIDETLMQELANIKNITKPDNILLVCDAMMGQDAVSTALTFEERLDLSGVVITKLDGDARGGAALSIKEVTGKPIKFLGIGEDLDKLEEFRPEGLASRILGMGDIVGLMQDFEKVVEDDDEEKAMKMLQGQFTLDDFYKQIEMIQKMGSLKDVAAKLPLQNLIPKGADIDDGELLKVKSMIDSMTKAERVKPGIINPSRSKRIASGSGRTTNDVTGLISKFSTMRKMMGMVGKNMGLMGKIPGLGGLSQMNQMRKMAQSGGFGDLLGMGGGGGSQFTKKSVDRDKQKKMRKLAKKARKKNRK